MSERLSISPLFSDGAVLQRDRVLKIQGRVAPASPIRLVLGKEVRTARGDASGRWEVSLPPHPAGGPYSMMVFTQEESLRIVDLFFGDIWILGGQSNMELPIRRVLTRFPDLVSSGDPLIRYIKAEGGVDFLKRHQDFVGGSWRPAIDQYLLDLSAVGFFFAHEIRRSQEVPIGLVMTARGGSCLGSWMSEETLSRVSNIPPKLHEMDEAYIRKEDEKFQIEEERYLDELDRRDTGLSEQWYRPGLDDSSWEELDAENFNISGFSGSGSVWLRRHVKVPLQFRGTDCQLRLGTMVDADETYVDGVRVGATGYQYPPRNYTLSRVKDDFQLTIRLKILHGSGGLTQGKPHLLKWDRDNATNLDLQGPWFVKRGCSMPDLRSQVFFSHLPVGNFNAVISPLEGFAVRGVLFYQGESDTGMPEGYARKMVALINEWRDLLGDAGLPFIFAQLPNYGLEPERFWPRLRDEQRRAAGVLPHSAMVVTLGMGEDNDLHPLDKRSLGLAFSRAAGVISYGWMGEPCGPLPVRATWDSQGGNVCITFQHVAQGLHLTGPLSLTIPDVGSVSGVIHDSCQLICHVGGGLNPRGRRIRYAWSDTAKPIISNSEGLLASPFELEIY